MESINNGEKNLLTKEEGIISTSSKESDIQENERLVVEKKKKYYI